MTLTLCIVSAVQLALTTISTGTDHPERTETKLCLELAYAATNTGADHTEYELCFAENAKKPKSASRVLASYGCTLGMASRLCTAHADQRHRMIPKSSHFLAVVPS